MASHSSLETNGQVTTTWMPLATQFPKVAVCETALYAMAATDIASGSIFAYGPGGPNTCLPDVLSTWWRQLGGSTVTSLGPFTCPEAYKTVYVDEGVGAGSTSIGCCPQSYTLNERVGFNNPKQCTSSVSAGSNLTYAVKVNDKWETSTTELATDLLVRGVHANGWIFGDDENRDNSTTTTISRQTSDPTSGAAIVAATGSGTGTQATGSSTTGTGSSDSGLSTGAIVGIGVGVGLAVIGLAALIAAIFFIRRHRAKKSPVPGSAELDSNDTAVAPVYVEKDADTSTSAGSSPPMAGAGMWGHEQRDVKGAGVGTSPYDDEGRTPTMGMANAPPKYRMVELQGSNQNPVELSSVGVRSGRVHEMG